MQTDGHLWTTRDVGDYFGRAPRTVRRWLRLHPELRGVQMGARGPWLFDPARIRQWVAEHSGAGPEAEPAAPTRKRGRPRRTPTVA